MLIRFLFKVLLIYGIWQLIRMMFSVKKTQQDFQHKMDEMHRDMNAQQSTSKKRRDDSDGEYIDYEEIK